MLTISDMKTNWAHRLNAYVVNRAHQKNDPIFDFLFEYYRFSPAKLTRCFDGFPATSASTFPDSRQNGLMWVINLIESIRDRPISIGCDGLHEWAMVYLQDHHRHPCLPLRLPKDEIDAFVATSTIRCSHFDAFRFFTPEARPLNRIQPHSENRDSLEQGGCLHVNMDLYKWAYTFHPWVSDGLIRDCFALAYDIRMVDMRASPYDMSPFGLQPIAIESPEGQQEYRREQLSFAERAKPLRSRLLQELHDLYARRFEDDVEQIGVFDESSDGFASRSDRR